MKDKTDLSVLFVCSGNFSYVPPFILEQKEGLIANGVRVELFRVVGKGVLGYLKNIRLLKQRLSKNEFQLVHGHFGLSGLVACLQGKLPVVITLHGSDIFLPRNRYFSKLANLLSDRTIIVNKKMEPLLLKKNATFIPCGVDTEVFLPMDKSEARKQLMDSEVFRFEEHKKYLLFSSSFNKEVKNPQLAKAAVEGLGSEYRLIELKGYNREQVRLLLNAVDACLLTSHSEGSPQFIKEAMACNRPLVSTDVGDVAQITEGIAGCFVVQSNRESVMEGIRQSLGFQSTDSRFRIEQEYENKQIVKRLESVYQQILNKAS